MKELRIKAQLCPEVEYIEAMLIDSLEAGWPLETVIEVILPVAFCHYTYHENIFSGKQKQNYESLSLLKTRSLSFQNLVTFFIDSFIDSFIIWTAAKYF